MLFKAYSQLITLTQLDRVLWDSDVPVAMLLEPDHVERLLNGMLVSHLRSHDTRNQGIVFSPESEHGIVHSLAEALAAIFEELDDQRLAAIPPAEWPARWREGLAKGQGIHRLLIIDQFEEILDSPFNERLEFCTLLSHFAAEESASVLLITDREYADCFIGLPGFQNLDSDANFIQQLSPGDAGLMSLEDLAGVKSDVIEAGQKLGKKERAPGLELAITSFGAVVMLVAVCAIYLQFPWSSLVTNHPIRQEIESLLIPDPSGYPIAQARMPFPGVSDIEEKVVAGNAPIKASLTETLLEPLECEKTEPAFKLPLVSEIVVEELEPELVVIPPPVPSEPVAVEVEPEDVSPFTVAELLNEYIELDLYESPSGLREALDFLREVLPNRDSSGVERWVAKIESDPGNREIALVNVLRGRGEDEAVFRLYQQHARRTSKPESYYQLGVAQFFGQGTSIDQAAAVKSFYRALIAGHADATFLYGIAQLRGLGGVTQDERKAYRMFNTAMDRGSLLPLRDAARMQELGLGEGQNLYWALHLYQQGAKNGEPYCMKRLAEIYQNGENSLVAPDKKAAQAWSKRSKTASEHPVLKNVSQLMAEDFYTRAVVRL